MASAKPAAAALEIIAALRALTARDVIDHPSILGRIYSSLHPHRLSLILAGADAALGAGRSTMDGTITRARPVLEGLIEEHRLIADHLSASEICVFNMAGQRIR